jgi:hypothetical protein
MTKINKLKQFAREKVGGNDWFKKIVVFLLIVFLAFFQAWITEKSEAVTIDINYKDLSEGVVNFNEINLAQDGSISLQDGSVGSWNNPDQIWNQHFRTNRDADPYMVYGPNDTIYFLPAYHEGTFYKYDIERRTWEKKKSFPTELGGGTSMAFDGGSKIYAVTDNGYKQMYVYDISLDKWTKLADAPANFGGGSSITYSSNPAPSIFAFTDYRTDRFFRYDIASNQWEEKSSFPSERSNDWGFRAEWDGGNYIYAISHLDREFRRYDISGDSWSGLLNDDPLWRANKHALISVDSDSLIFLITDDRPDRSFLKEYNPQTNSWTNLAQPPAANSWGYDPAAAYDGDDYIYFSLGGEYRRYFYRYQISTDSWSNEYTLYANQDEYETFDHGDMALDDQNQKLYYAAEHSGTYYNKLMELDLNTREHTTILTRGDQELWEYFNGNILYKNNSLYLIAGYRDDDNRFIRYDLDTDSWVDLAATPWNVGRWYSGDFVDGKDGYLYLTHGHETRDFARYNIAGDSWETLADSPDYFDGPASKLAKIGDYIYASTGDRFYSGKLFRYHVPTNSWEEVASYPKMNHNGSMVGDGNRYLYFVFDDRTETSTMSHHYKFDTQNNSWQRLATPPSWADVGEMEWDSTNSRIYYAPSYYQPYLWSWQDTGQDYVSSGEWYSKTYDLTHVANWNSLSADVSGGGSAIIYTRTSSDGQIWNNWQAVTGDTINSTPNRYLQIKISLSGDGTETPTVSNINLDYSQDVTAPSNPSDFSAYSDSSKEDEIESGQLHEHIHPYFTWSGSSDGSDGSGVKGYYVYFGNDATADPETEGSFQTRTNYEGSTAMTAGEVYYLRIKTVDNLDNVSSAATYFSYRYWYVSPPEEQTITSQADFEEGSNYNLDLTTNPGSMKLNSKTDGAWSLGWAETPPENLNRGSGVYANDYLYVLGGENTTFYRFNPKNGDWINLAETPTHTGEGGNLVWGGGDYIYMIPGEGRKGIYRYDTGEDSWEEVGQTPIDQDDSTIMVGGDGDNLYFSFAGFANFYQYNLESGTWTMLSEPPASLYYRYRGQGAYYDGDNTIYVHFGTGHSYGFNNKSFAKYNITQDKWTELPKPPEYYGYTYHNLVSDGQGNLYRFGHRNINFSSTYGLKYSIEEERWYEIDNIKASFGDGFLVSDNERYIYIYAPHTSNNNSRRMIIYDTKKDKVVPNIYDPSMLYHHGQQESEWLRASPNAGMTTDGEDKIYLSLHGHHNESTNYLVEYDLNNDSYEVIAATPYNPRDESSIAYSQGNIYWFPGDNTQEFYRFDLHDERWYQLADPPSNMEHVSSSGMIADNQGRVYLPQGDNTSFYRFNPDGDQGSWEVLTNFPGSFHRGALIYDQENQYIYVVRGRSTTDFYRYDINSDSFTVLDSLPEGTGYGNGAVINNGKIYMTRGHWSDTMFIYDVASDNWRVSETNAPEPGEEASGFVKAGDKAYGMFGDGVGYFWQFNFPDNNKGYEGKGSYTSKIIEREGIVDYANITIHGNIPDDTDLEIYTRSSDDNETWTDWQITEDINLFSDRVVLKPATAAKQYTQVKITFYSYNNFDSPTVNNINLNYYYDLDPPDNPTSVSVYQDENKEETIDSGDWNNYDQAYFTWPLPGEVGGATDGDLGSNVEGYYVYLGTDETADPLTAGEYTTDNFYQPGFGSSGVYYFRLKTVDLAGNVSQETFANYTFKLDIDPPDNPPVISVTPSGFTAENNYTFEWNQASDSGGSGLNSYCYKTGASEGAYASENCTTETSLENIEVAYKQGTNVFYLRSLDNAGNYGENTTEVSYYYSTEAPSPVTNLEAIPASSEQNLFAFNWDLPVSYSGDPAQITYHYSINELPGSHNTTATVERNLAPFAAANQEGSNVLYVVAEDESGNINWNNYASTTFIANTTAPGIPRNFSVSDISDQDSERWMMVLSWQRPTFEGNGVDRYIVERSKTGHQFNQLGTISDESYVDTQIKKNETYFYRVRASDDVGNYGGATNTIEATVQGKYNNPPDIVSKISYNASFNQAIVSWVTERPATSFVHYGTDPNSLDNSKGSLDLTTDHQVTLTGLEPNTLYYFKAQSFDQERNYSLDNTYSKLYSFLTDPAAEIKDVTISDISLNSAVVSWITTVPTKSRIKYGTNSSYGLFTDGEKGYDVKHTQKIVGLNHSSNYKFRIEAATPISGNMTSDEYSFSTLAFPKINNISFQPIKDAPTTSVNISWDTNVPTTSVVSYRLGGETKELSQSEMTKNHQLKLTDLADDSDYVIRISGRDKYGNLVTSDPQKWHSLLDTREPEIKNLTVEHTILGAGRGVEGQPLVSLQTNEPTTSQVEYNVGSESLFDQVSIEDNSLKTEHVVVISGLELAQIYNIRPLSRDSSGNKSYGKPTIVTTDQIEMSILDFILDIFEKMIDQIKTPPPIIIYNALKS